MIRAFFKLVCCICFVQNSLGLPSLTCDDVDPILSSTVKCSCQNVGAPGIDWYRGGVYITPCTIGGQCFISMGYTFTVDVTTSTYTIEFGSYNYTECTNVTCSDSTTPSDSAFKHISVDVASYSPTITKVTEPSASHLNGNITFTTDCIYKTGSPHINVKAKWKAVVNETEADDLDIDETISTTGSCQVCTDNFASKVVVSVNHQEDQSKSRIQAKIRLLLFINGTLYPDLNRTTKNEYYVKGKNKPSVSNATTSITNSTSTSDVIKNTTTNSDKNGTHYNISSTSVLPNSTFVTAVPEKVIKRLKYAAVLYTVLACFAVISTVVMITYYFCLTTNERKTNENENNQRDQQNYTDISKTSRL